jgi:hypothetical protein
MDPVRRVNVLLDEAAQLDIGHAQVAHIERAVRLADSIEDDDLSFGARIELLTAATFAGMPERSLVAFAWLLAKADAQPERFDVEQLLFPYRWIVEDVPYLLSVSADRVDALIDDMAIRYDRHWWWDHPVWEARMRWAMVRGAPGKEVDELYRRWKLEFGRSGNPRGGHEVHAEVLVLTYLERYEDAVETARPSLSGTLPAEEEYPARTYAVLLEAGRALNHLDCDTWRARAADLCAGNQVFVREVAMVVCDAMRAGETPPTQLVADLRRWVESTRDEHGIMSASAALALVDTPETQHHRERALALAEAFDARHGNNHACAQIRRLLAHS